MADRRILVLFAHPAVERSRVNRRLFEAARAVRGVTVRDLYELYPSLAIDVAAEQDALVAHDVIVFQHPFYWYSVPAILKEWQDVVLELGWAYGSGGDALRGKITFNVVTTGGAASAYVHGGYNRFTMRELLSPWDQTAHLCGMRFLAPLAIHGALRLSTDAEVKPHGDRYVRALELVRDDRLDLDRASVAKDLSEVLDEASKTAEATP